jgi:caffeoyl-CoA O-methyltransferase
MKSISLTPELYDYLLAHSLRETDLQRRLREETEARPMALMQAPPEEAQFLALLIELIDARRCLEVGVFTGYSTLAMALALPDDGRIVACDIDEETSAVARRYWREAGVDDRIDMRIADARETLQGLIDGGEAGTYDLAFLDADKTSYADYYEQILILLRPRGLLVIDNVLWNGAVADPAKSNESTEALRALNTKLHADDRISLSLLPVGDGITLALKR